MDVCASEVLCHHEQSVSWCSSGKYIINIRRHLKMRREKPRSVCLCSSFCLSTHKIHPQMEAHTNLVHLSIGAISDHFYQLENPSRVLQCRAKTTLKGSY